MARERFGLELAVGLVPVSALRAAGHQVLVARHQISANAVQAVFRGDGLDVAEGWVKNGDHALSSSGEETADFSGLECRWRQVESTQGETIALLVSATSRDLAERSSLYAEVINLIEAAYGSDARPVRAEALHLARSPRALSAERNVRTFGAGPLGQSLSLPGPPALRPDRGGVAVLSAPRDRRCAVASLQERCGGQHGLPQVRRHGAASPQRHRRRSESSYAKPA